MEDTQPTPITTIIQKKPKKIVILQWLFLVLTILIILSQRDFLFYIPQFKDIYMAIMYFAFILPFILLGGITICLFLNTKKSMALVMPFAITAALLIIFLLQYFHFNLIIGFFGINLTDLSNFIETRHPGTTEFFKTRPIQAWFIFSSISMIFSVIIYGIPLLLLFILHKIIKRK